MTPVRLGVQADLKDTQLLHGSVAVRSGCNLLMTFCTQLWLSDSIWLYVQVADQVAQATVAQATVAAMVAAAVAPTF